MQRLFHSLYLKTINKVSVGPLKMDDEVVVDNTRMASILNTWYCSVFTDEDVTNMPEVEICCEEGEELETVEFTAEKSRRNWKS